jgi:hypothetical protein
MTASRLSLPDMAQALRMEFPPTGLGLFKTGSEIFMESFYRYLSRSEGALSYPRHLVTGSFRESSIPVVETITVSKEKHGYSL